MEDSLLSVEELSICFGDNKVVSEEKDFVKDEDEDDIQCELMRMRMNDEKPLRLKINKTRSPTSRQSGQKVMSSKHSPLPSLGDRNLAENFEQNREKQDAVWSLCSALNVPSKDQSISGSDPQLHLCAKRSENKLGRTILAPIQDKKHHLYAKQNESLALKPQTPTRGKQKKSEKELDHEVHFTPISKSPTFGHEEDPGEKRCEKMTKPLKFLSPTQGLKEEEAGLDYNSNRRFSMPVSPRLLRRFNKDKVYSSKVEGSERKNKHNYPERSSIFSPPSKEFDSIQDQKEQEGLHISNDFIPRSARRENRRSLDLNLDMNSLRFLSEIKVSFGREPATEPVLPRVSAKPEQRKNSYSLSVSSETIFRESLPEVAPLLPPVQANGRNRAATFTSLEAVVPSFESKMSGKTTLEAPMFLEVGSKRLSHLSLSPRLSRKH